MRTEGEHGVENVVAGRQRTPAPTTADENPRHALAQGIADQIVEGHGSVVETAQSMTEANETDDATGVALEIASGESSRIYPGVSFEPNLVEQLLETLIEVGI